MVGLLNIMKRVSEGQLRSLALSAPRSEFALVGNLFNKNPAERWMSHQILAWCSYIIGRINLENSSCNHLKEKLITVTNTLVDSASEVKLYVRRTKQIIYSNVFYLFSAFIPAEVGGSDQEHTEAIKHSNTPLV